VKKADHVHEHVHVNVDVDVVVHVLVDGCLGLFEEWGPDASGAECAICGTSNDWLYRWNMI
jgi:hypothetical protein